MKIELTREELQTLRGWAVECCGSSTELRDSPHFELLTKLTKALYTDMEGELKLSRIPQPRYTDVCLHLKDDNAKFWGTAWYEGTGYDVYTYPDISYKVGGWTEPATHCCFRYGSGSGDYISPRKLSDLRDQVVVSLPGNYLACLSLIPEEVE